MEDESPKFRQEAIDHLGEQDQVDRLISITSRKAWLLLITLMIVVSTALL